MDRTTDPQLKEAATLVSRKRQQLEHLREFDEAVVALKGKVKEAEGQDMREAIQDKVGCLHGCVHREAEGQDVLEGG